MEWGLVYGVRVYLIFLGIILVIFGLPNEFNFSPIVLLIGIIFICLGIFGKQLLRRL